MKNYDFTTAKRLIEEHKEQITSASLGMHEDWFWTAQTVWVNGEFTKQLPDNEYAIARYNEYREKRKAGMSAVSEESMNYSDIEIGGIYGSDWATPTLQLTFHNGDDKMMPCFIVDGQPSNKNPFVIELGPMSGPVQANITPLTEL